jgi:putative inorganic carbon (hco3(-)) transporter
METTKTSSGLDWVRPLIGLLVLASGLILGLSGRLITQPFYILLLVVGIVGVLAVVTNVERGIFVLLLMDYVRLREAAVLYNNAFTIFKPFVVFLVAMIVVRWIMRKEAPKGWYRGGILLLLYGIVIGISLLYSSNWSASYGGVFIYSRDVLIALLIILLVQRTSILRGAIWSLMIAGLLLGVINIYQYQTGTFTDPYWGFAQANFSQIVGSANAFRIGGPIGDPNFFALIMVPIIPMALERLLGEKRNILKALAGITLIICFVTVVLTYSRGAMIGVVALILVILVQRPERSIRNLLLLIVALGVVGFSFLPSNYVNRFSAAASVLTNLAKNGTGVGGIVEDTSITGRASEFLVSLQMFRDNPIFGVGKNNYPFQYLDYSYKIGLDPRLEQRTPHNLYLEVLAESGIVGIVVFGLVVGNMLMVPLNARRKLIRAGNKAEAAHMIQGISYAVIGVLVGSLFLQASYPRYFWIIFGLSLATLNVADNELADD